MRRLMCECRECHDVGDWSVRYRFPGQRVGEVRVVCLVHLQLLERGAREGALRLLGRPRSVALRRGAARRG